MARRLDTPKGSSAIEFAATAMLVVGVGLAWSGLLLAAAGVILSVIEFLDLKRRNPWIAPSGDGADWPIAAPAVKRISQANFAVVVVASACALAAVQVSGEALLALPPAVVAGVAAVLLDRRLRAAIEAAANGEPAE